VVYEDAQLLVVNKAAHMVVHPSAGHAGGTLVNAVLHHCALPPLRLPPGAAARAGLLPEEADAEDGDEPALPASAGLGAATLRPGIVHRRDKGTSGLLVVAKTGEAHAALCAQFAARSVHRRYAALHVGCPPTPGGRVEAPIGRDTANRLRMAVLWAPGARARAAASRWERGETLCRGGACLMSWRLETGRTHQVRVHSKELGFPLIGDALYGGTEGAAAAAMQRAGLLRAQAEAVLAAACAEGRPMLHAAELGFSHPATGEWVQWAVEPPEDFQRALEALQALI